ncbi:integrase, partial [Pseudomonas aeruginosa]
MKRSDIKRRPLSDTVLSSLEPEAKEYREKYGVDRIYLVVSPNGRKRWEMRHKKPDGKWSWLGLGGYPDVSAKRAREKALEILGMASDGVDPFEKKSRRVDLFRDVAEEWYQRKADQGRAELT